MGALIHATVLVLGACGVVIAAISAVVLIVMFILRAVGLLA